MDAPDRFMRFAAECEVMAQIAPSPENRAVWNGLAQRWIRCAELLDQRDSVRPAGRSTKRRGNLASSSTH
jgi:hypothetical protein